MPRTNPNRSSKLYLDVIHLFVAHDALFNASEVCKAMPVTYSEPEIYNMLKRLSHEGVLNKRSIGHYTFYWMSRSAFDEWGR